MAELEAHAVTGALWRPPIRPPVVMPKDLPSPAQPELHQTFKKALALLAAPPALVTAILYWLGFRRTEAFWTSFGVEPSLLNFSTTDYLVRAVDTAFPFLTLLLLGIVVGAALHVYARQRLHLGDYFLSEALSWILLLLGILYFTPVAASDLFHENLAALDVMELTHRHMLVGPLYGLLAVAAVGYGSSLLWETRKLRRPRSALRFNGSPRLGAAHRSGTLAITTQVLIVAGSGLALLMLFWLTDRLATATGRERAREALRAHLPEAVVYSSSRLHITGDGVSEQPLNPQDGIYKFRYSGFQFLLYSRNSYVLIPSQTRRAFLLPESENIRLEYRPG